VPPLAWLALGITLLVSALSFPIERRLPRIAARSRADAIRAIKVSVGLVVVQVIVVPAIDIALLAPVGMTAWAIGLFAAYCLVGAVAGAYWLMAKRQRRMPL
jgi:hypothetical protein